VSDTTENRGGRRAPPTATAYFLSKDKKKSRSDKALGRRRAVKRLGSRKSSRGSKRVSVPAVSLGSYFVLACADARGAAKEANERNNCRASARSVQVIPKSPTGSSPSPGGGDNTTPGGGGTTTPPPTAHGAPTGLTAAPDANGEADLAWSAVAGATSYRVLRSGSSGGPYTEVASVPDTDHTDTGLGDMNRLFYVVRATGPGGESANSNEASALGCVDSGTDDTLSPSVPDLGETSGDFGAVTINVSGSICRGDTDWRTVRVTELESSNVGKEMQLRTTMTPGVAAEGAAGNPDLFAFVNQGSDIFPTESDFGANSTNAGTSVDTVFLEWGEGGIDNGSDDGRTVAIKVTGATGSASNRYDLAVRGHPNP